MTAPVAANPYLHLSETPIRFPPVEDSTSVFYDEDLRQVFTVFDDGARITVATVGSPQVIEMTLPARGPVISMKLSPDQRVLAVQRTSRTVQFINVYPGASTQEYVQSCKSRSSAHLLGFSWTTASEIAFFTSQGVELYAVNPERRTTKCLKTANVTTNWHVYNHESRICLLSSTPYANVLHPVHFRAGGLTRFSKFEVELPAGFNQVGQKLLERDVSVGTIYGQLYVLLLKNNPKGAPGPPAEVSLCRLAKDGATKVHSLALATQGRFFLNLVDNLVVVHHQVSKTSAIFDIAWNQSAPPRDGRGRCLVHQPVVLPMSIAPVALPAVEAAAAASDEGVGRGGQAARPCELYTPTWIVFQPDVVIDAKLGALWTVNLELPPIVKHFTEPDLLVSFLLPRSNSKPVILEVVRNAILGQAPLPVIAKMFDRFNAVIASTRDAPGSRVGYQCVTQEDLYLIIFAKLDSLEPRLDHKFTVAVLVEYLRSLNQYDIAVQHYLYELVIDLLVEHNRYYQLHQFLQYHVVKDSKHVACFLLVLQRTYPPAFQLALDMFKRLGDANEEIFDVLLSQNQLLAALRFIRSIGPGAVASVSARRFLEAAMNSGDDMLFFTVYQFFEQRNIQLRRSRAFLPGEGCERFEQHYQKLFGTKSMGE